MKTLKELQEDIYQLPEIPKEWEDLYTSIVKVLELSDQEISDMLQYFIIPSSEHKFGPTWIEYVMNSYLTKGCRILERYDCITLKKTRSREYSYHGSMSDTKESTWEIYILSESDVLRKLEPGTVYYDYPEIKKIITTYQTRTRALIEKVSGLFPFKIIE